MLLLNVVQLVLFRRTAGRLRRLTHLLQVGTRGNLDDLIEETNANVANMHRKLDDLTAWRRKTDETLARCVRTPVMVRYRAFDGVGGDQSYSFAVLDGKGDGIVLTSLYSKNSSYSYGKPVQQGRSDYQLSREEEDVVGRVLEVRE
ncbi:MAG: DUF4446 family protein [Candidatus Desulforudis sp.]|nr:DUF4446 family protein [Desulforudis sp.]